MSTLFRKMLVCVVAVCAASVVNASAALAVDELAFKFTGTGAKAKLFKGKSGVTTLEDSAGVQITCSSDSSKGEIEGASPSENVTSFEATFKGCKGPLSTKCKSVGAGSDEIVTDKLVGEVGLLTNPATGEETLGLELQPKAGPLTPFAKFKCGIDPESEVRGTIFAAMTPLDTVVKVGGHFSLDYDKLAGKGVQEFTDFFNDPNDGEFMALIGGGWKRAAFESDGTIEPEEGTVEVTDDPS